MSGGISLAAAIERINTATAEEWSAHRADVEWALAQARYHLAHKNAELELWKSAETAYKLGVVV
jgi:hypothetical protein